tara:strand:+ start:12777 stop:14393 length:1617 start_codon:yes stop_codon:yes gene_type:complete
MSYKYTAKFENEVLASTNLYNEEWNISDASLDKLKGLIPESVDLKKNIDLIGVAFNAAVVNRFNKNDDAIDTKTAIAIKDYFVNKPTNIEHQKQKVVGHIVSAAFSEFGENKIITDVEAAALDGPFNIALGAVVYKTVNPQFAHALDQAEEEGWDKVISASWELGFNKYSIAMGESDDLNNLEIITKPEQIEEFKQYLRAYGGEGKTQDGIAVKRLVSGEIYPLGIAFTASPAADVEGVYVEKESRKPVTIQEDDAHKEGGIICINDKCFVRGLINLEEKISHSFETDVIQHNRQAMENQDIINKLEELLQRQAEPKEGNTPVNTEEAVASVSQFVFEAIRQKSDEYVQEKEKALAEKNELLRAEEELKASMGELEEKLSATENQLAELQQEKLERQAKERFNERMAIIDAAYELADEDLTVIATEVNALGEDDDEFEAYKQKFAVVWQHKSKEAVAAAQEQIQAQIDEEVQKRLQESSASVTAEPQSEEEVVDQALDNADQATATIPNTNEEISQEEDTLRQRFKSAFNQDNLTIKY